MNNTGDYLAFAASAPSVRKIGRLGARLGLAICLRRSYIGSAVVARILW